MICRAQPPPLNETLTIFRLDLPQILHPVTHFTMASLFQSLSEDMEKVIHVVEEGTKIIMGTSSHMGDQSATYPSDSGDVYETDEDGFLEDGRDMGTPLMGMADSVLSDIMLNQVSCSMYYTSWCCCCSQVTVIHTSHNYLALVFI